MEAKHEIVTMGKELPVRYLYINDSKPTYTLPHFHSELEILYLLTGSLTVTQGIKTTFLTPGDIIIFNSNEIHSTQTLNSYTTTHVLQISFEYLNNIFENQSTIRLQIPLISEATDNELNNIKKIQNTIKSFYQTSSSQEPFNHVKLHGILYFLLYEIYKNFIDTKNPITYFYHKEFQRIKKIDDYLKENYYKSITLHEISTYVGLTNTYFSRFFKNTFGLPFSKYLSSLRLENARIDILTTNYAILYISEKNGFANYQLFTKSFKQMFGCTPLSYRKNYSHSHDRL